VIVSRRGSLLKEGTIIGEALCGSALSDAASFIERQGELE
jgi:hypothetical protein